MDIVPLKKPRSWFPPLDEVASPKRVIATTTTTISSEMLDGHLHQVNGPEIGRTGDCGPHDATSTVNDSSEEYGGMETDTRRETPRLEHQGLGTPPMQRRSTHQMSALAPPHLTAIPATDVARLNDQSKQRKIKKRQSKKCIKKNTRAHLTIASLNMRGGEAMPRSTPTTNGPQSTTS